MRAYELAVVVRADLTEEELSSQLSTIQGWIAGVGGSVVETNTWGRRRLAYPVSRQRDGYYVIYTLQLPPDAPTQLERQMRIAENVLRSLVIRKDE